MTDPFAGVEPRRPRPDGLNAAFYEHAAGGRVHIQRCRSCAQFQHPPRHLCRACASSDLEWAPVTGRGSLYSWTTTHFPFDRGWTAAAPYSTGVIELPEGVRVVAALSPDVVPSTELPLRLVTALHDDGSVLLYLVPAN